VAGKEQGHWRIRRWEETWKEGGKRLRSEVTVQG
jgi:hypothetical protein